MYASFKNIIRAAAFGVAVIAAAAVPTQKAHADSRGGAVIAGIAGGLILGSIIASAAKADKGHHSVGVVKKHHYAPPVVHSFGFKSGHHFGHRRHFGKGFHNGHRRHFGKRFHSRHNGHFKKRFHRKFHHGHGDFRRGFYGH